MLTYEQADDKVKAEADDARKTAREKYGMIDRAEINAFVIGWLSSALRNCMLELANERSKNMSRMR